MSISTVFTRPVELYFQLIVTVSSRSEKQESSGQRVVDNLPGGLGYAPDVAISAPLEWRRITEAQKTMERLRA